MVIWFGRLNGWYSQVYSCVCLPGGDESMSAWGEQQEEGNKRGSVNNREWKSGINYIKTLEEIILHWMEKGSRSGAQTSRQSWVLMQNRLLTLSLDLWPPLSLWQEVRPCADRKHSSKLHACGSRSYLYPIIVPRFEEPGSPWGEKDPQELRALLVATHLLNDFIVSVIVLVTKDKIGHKPLQTQAIEILKHYYQGWCFQRKCA